MLPIRDGRSRSLGGQGMNARWRRFVYAGLTREPPRGPHRGDHRSRAWAWAGVRASCGERGAQIIIVDVAPADPTLLVLYNALCHWGAIVVAPGYNDQSMAQAGGNPYGTAHASAGGSPGTDVLAAARIKGADSPRSQG
jgi:hypothetical protein